MVGGEPVGYFASVGALYLDRASLHFVYVETIINPSRFLILFSINFTHGVFSKLVYIQPYFLIKELHSNFIQFYSSSHIPTRPAFHDPNPLAGWPPF